MRRLRRLLLALLGTFAVAGTPAFAGVLPPQAQCIPAPALGAACTPEGAIQAPPPKVRTLTGSSITIDAAGLRLIGSFEGYERCAYWDPNGHVWTVGFGQTHLPNGHPVYDGFCFADRSAAEANLKDSIESEYQWAVRALDVNLCQTQIDGLDSFDYNLGAGIFVGELRSALQHREWSRAATIMRQYDHAGGVVLPGLVTRRDAEAVLVEESSCPSPAQVHTERVERLRADEAELVKLRHRIAVLRGVLLSRGCDRLRDERRPVGPTCERWFREGHEDHVRGVALDGQVAVLKRELA